MDDKDDITLQNSVGYNRNYGFRDNLKAASEYANNFRELDGEVSRVSNVLESLFNMVLASVLLLIFSPLFFLIILGIKLSSSGPVLFKQIRTGLGGKEFVCYKFRTMYLVSIKSEGDGPVITKKGDKRIFTFGSILRKTNLDEIPQLFNVLRREMNIIGPRPYPVEEDKHWSKTFKEFHYRYLVRPGITGFAQASGYVGGTLDEEHMRKRLDYDLIYVQRRSLFFDLKILLKTIINIFPNGDRIFSSAKIYPKRDVKGEAIFAIKDAIRVYGEFLNSSEEQIESLENSLGITNKDD